MSIKLIYGKNGDGKSWYSEKEEENSIKLTSDIANWYDNEKKQISEYNFLAKKKLTQIEKLEKKVLSNESSLQNIKGFSISKLKAFLKNIDFNTLKKWNAYKKNNKTFDLEIPDLIDLHNFCKGKNLEILKNLTIEEKELIKLKINFSFKDYPYSEKIAIKFNNELKIIDNKIEQLLKGIDFSIFSKLKIKDIERIFSNNAKLIDENIENKIKNIIIQSDEYKEIKNLKKQLEKIKEKSIIFNKNKDYEIVDNGYAIKIDLGKKKYSSGQKVAQVLKIIINSIENSKKKIILDDFFEKLDVQNQEKAFISIANKENKTFEILTHDERTVEIIQTIKHKNNIVIEEWRVELENKKPKLRKSVLTLTFHSLNLKIWDNEKLDEFDKINLFAKIFGRCQAKSGAITGNCLNNIRKNKNSQSYKLTSNVIFHYDDDIDYTKLNERFSLSLNKNVNSLELIDNIANLYESTNCEKNDVKKYGISYKKVKEYILSIKPFLEQEKKYFESLSEIPQNTYKNNLYKKFWNENKKLKKERNNVMHKLDNTLIDLSF